MELRFRNDDDYSATVEFEVCSDDQWYVLPDDRIDAGDYSPLQNITEADVGSTAVTLAWLPQMDYGNATYFDISCTTTTDDRRFITTTITVSGNTTMARIDGLHQDTVYDCCVIIHYFNSFPLHFTAKTCTSVKTLMQLDRDKSYACSRINITVLIGLGIALGFVILLLMVTAIASSLRWKKNQ